MNPQPSPGALAAHSSNNKAMTIEEPKDWIGELVKFARKRARVGEARRGHWYHLDDKELEDIMHAYFDQHTNAIADELAAVLSNLVSDSRPASVLSEDYANARSVLARYNEAKKREAV